MFVRFNKGNNIMIELSSLFEEEEESDCLNVSSLLGYKVLVDNNFKRFNNEPAIVIGYYAGRYSVFKNYLAIEFENPGIGFHNCEGNDFYIIKPAKNNNGFYIDRKFVTLITKKPHIGKRRNTKLIGV